MLRRSKIAAVLAGLLTAACFAGAAVGAPGSLTDATLDGITAGSDAQQPVAAGKLPAVIVADGASYAFSGDLSVRLAADTQSRLRALNVVGTAGSDVGNAANVLTLGSATQARQHNLLDQRDGRGGSLGRASLAGTAVVSSVSAESGSTRSTASATANTRIQRAHLHDSTVAQYSLSVPDYEPLQNLTLEVEAPQLAPLQIPEVTLNLIDTDWFGIEGTAGPFTVGAPQLVLGAVRLSGDDIVIDSGYVQTPSVDLGNASMQVCFGESSCARESVALGLLPAQRIDLPQADLHFEGANPFKDTHINAGQGVALVGDGSVSTTPGHVTLSGQFTLDLPDPTFSVDFTIPSISGDDDGLIGPWTIDGPDITVEILPVTVSHTLIDEDVGPAYSGTFDGVLCLVQGSMECGQASRSTRQLDSRVESVASTSSDSENVAAYRSLNARSDLLAGADLTNAEADLIAMSQASASIDSTNAVSLDETAQRGMRAVNGVNASDAIIGNALNVTTVRGMAMSMASPARAALGQSNVFEQLRTGYGR